MSRGTYRSQKSLGHHVRMLIGSVAIGALVAASTTLAHAEDATINSMSLSTETPLKKNTVYVELNGGVKWDTILPGQVEFWAGMQVDTKWPGYVQDAGIFLGTCVDRQCGESNSPLLFFESVMRRDYGNAKNISFSTDKLQLSGILPAADSLWRRDSQAVQQESANRWTALLRHADGRGLHGEYAQRFRQSWSV